MAPVEQRFSSPAIRPSRWCDLAGQRFGLLVAETRVPARTPPPGQKTKWAWLCRCDCGRSTVVVHANLKNGHTTSCGCVKRQAGFTSNLKHGCARHSGKSPEYASWTHMKTRCLNPNHEHFESYGGRGIRVCERWLNSFEDFLKDMGTKPSGRHEIERRDVNADYEPANCYWATRTEQVRNRRNTLRATLDGETRSLAEWCERIGTPLRVVHERLSNGWDLETAIRTPKGARRVRLRAS
jgi:hypothetical protein